MRHTRLINADKEIMIIVAKKTDKSLAVSAKIYTFAYAIEQGGYQSGQMGQTVNLLAFAFGGSNPSPPTTLPNICINEIFDLFRYTRVFARITASFIFL